MIRTLKAAGYFLQAAFVLAVAYTAYVDYYPGASVRIFTNVDEHTPLNHGQRSIEVTLPHGVVFASFGGCSPSWFTDETVIVWHKLNCDVEKFDPTTGEYSAAPPRRGQSK